MDMEEKNLKCCGMKERNNKLKTKKTEKNEKSHCRLPQFMLSGERELKKKKNILHFQHIHIGRHWRVQTQA